MALFKYTALSAVGKKQTGFVTADSFELAKKKLTQEKIFVTALYEWKLSKSALKFSESEKLHFTRDMAALLRSGLPLYEALVMMEEKQKGTPHHAIYLDISEQVKLGKTLSTALKSHPSSFDEVYASLVEAGEHTGNLEGVFAQIEKVYGRQAELKKQLSSAMLYPAFLLVFCVAVLGLLFFVLVPMLKEMFEGKTLHPITELVIQISTFFTEKGVFLGGAVAIAILSASIYLKTKSGKKNLERFLFSLPIIQRVYTQSSLHKFALLLSILLHSGVALLDALSLAANVVKSSILREKILEARETTLRGGAFSQVFLQSRYFPSLFSRMIAVAEESGNLEAMLLSIAGIYEEELERSLKRFSSLLQPIILLLLGSIVGIVLIAVLLPMSDVSSLLE